MPFKCLCIKHLKSPTEGPLSAAGRAGGLHEQKGGAHRLHVLARLCWPLTVLDSETRLTPKGEMFP